MSKQSYPSDAEVRRTLLSDSSPQYTSTTFNLIQQASCHQSQNFDNTLQNQVHGSPPTSTVSQGPIFTVGLPVIPLILPIQQSESGFQTPYFPNALSAYGAGYRLGQALSSPRPLPPPYPYNSSNTSSSDQFENKSAAQHLNGLDRRRLSEAPAHQSPLQLPVVSQQSSRPYLPALRHKTSPFVVQQVAIKVCKSNDSQRPPVQNQTSPVLQQLISKPPVLTNQEGGSSGTKSSKIWTPPTVQTLWNELWNSSAEKTPHQELPQSTVQHQTKRRSRIPNKRNKAALAADTEKEASISSLNSPILNFILTNRQVPPKPAVSPSKAVSPSHMLISTPQSLEIGEESPGMNTSQGNMYNTNKSAPWASGATPYAASSAHQGRNVAEGGPTVVDLDEEDIDDCMLTSIDLSKQILPVGKSIHNTQVVIDSDDEVQYISPPKDETPATLQSRTNKDSDEVQPKSSSEVPSIQKELEQNGTVLDMSYSEIPSAENEDIEVYIDKDWKEEPPDQDLGCLYQPQTLGIQQGPSITGPPPWPQSTASLQEISYQQGQAQWQNSGRPQTQNVSAVSMDPHLQQMDVDASKGSDVAAVNGTSVFLHSSQYHTGNEKSATSTALPEASQKSEEDDSCVQIIKSEVDAPAEDAHPQTSYIRRPQLPLFTHQIENDDEEEPQIIGPESIKPAPISDAENESLDEEADVDIEGTDGEDDNKRLDASSVTTDNPLSSNHATRNTNEVSWNQVIVSSGLATKNTSAVASNQVHFSKGHAAINSAVSKDQASAKDERSFCDNNKSREPLTAGDGNQPVVDLQCGCCKRGFINGDLQCGCCKRGFINGEYMRKHLDTTVACRLYASLGSKVKEHEIIMSGLCVCLICQCSFHTVEAKYQHVSKSVSCLQRYSMLESNECYCMSCNRGIVARDKEDHMAQSLMCKERAIKQLTESNSLSAEVARHNTGMLLMSAGVATLSSMNPSTSCTVRCEGCSAWFSSYARFKLHIRCVERCKQYYEQRYTSKSKVGEEEELKKQPQNTLNKPLILCPVCGKKFATNAMLTIHLNENTSCRGKFLNKQTSKVAKRKEIDKDKKVTTSSTGDRTAETSKPYQHQEDNSKSFAAKLDVDYNLKKVAIKLSQATAMCSVCHKPFLDEEALFMHKMAQPSCQIKTNTTQFQCIGCKEYFLGDVGLAMHIQRSPSCQDLMDKTSASCSAQVSHSAVARKRSAPAMKKSTSARMPVKHQELRVVDIDKPGPNKTHPQVIRQLQPFSTSMNCETLTTSHSVEHLQSPVVDQDELEEIADEFSSDDQEGSSSSSTSSDEADVEFKCKTCDEVFTEKLLFKRHMKEHRNVTSLADPPVQKIKCIACRRKLKGEKAFQAHLLKNSFCFLKCTKQYWSKRAEEVMSCSICKKVLKTGKDLGKHCFKNMTCRLSYVDLVLKQMKTSTKEASAPSGPSKSEAASCLAKVKEVPSVHQHFETVPTQRNETDSALGLHEEQANLRCNYCQKTFTSMHVFVTHFFSGSPNCLDHYGTLDSHMQSQVPYCFRCKTRFINVTKLRNHRCIGFRRYVRTCSHCNFKFPSLATLEAHAQNNDNCAKALENEEREKLIPQSSQKAKAVAKKGTNPLPQKQAVAKKQTNPLSLKQVSSMPIAHESGKKTVAKKSTTQRKLPQGSPNSLKVFTCRVCSQRYTSISLLLEHSHKHTEEKEFDCKRCGFICYRYNRLVSHESVHERLDKECGRTPDRLDLQAAVITDEEDVGDYSTPKIVKKENNAQQESPRRLLLEMNVEEPATKRQHVSPALNKSSVSQASTETKEVQKKTQASAHLEKPLVEDKLFCKYCKIFLKSEDDIKQHTMRETTFSHFLIPQSLYRKAVWKGQLRCKTCKWNCNSYKGLKDHMLKHHLKAHPLLELVTKYRNEKLQVKHASNAPSITKKQTAESALVPKTQNGVTCRLCKKILHKRSKRRHFCYHLKLIVSEVKGQSDQPQYMETQESCSICGKPFPNRKSLLRHLRHIHNPNDIFEIGGVPLNKAGAANTASPPQSLVGSFAASNTPGGKGWIGKCKLCLRKKVKSLKELKEHLVSYHKRSSYCPSSFLLKDSHLSEHGKTERQTFDTNKSGEDKVAPENNKLKTNFIFKESKPSDFSSAMETPEKFNKQSESSGRGYLFKEHGFMYCNFCRTKLRAKHFREHLLKNHKWHEDRLFACKYCQLDFPLQRLCKKHEDQCERDCKCHICGRQMQGKINLCTHAWNIHKVKWDEYVEKYGEAKNVVGTSEDTSEDSLLGNRPKDAHVSKVLDYPKECDLCKTWFQNADDYMKHVQTHLVTCRVQMGFKRENISQYNASSESAQAKALKYNKVKDTSTDNQTNNPPTNASKDSGLLSTSQTHKDNIYDPETGQIYTSEQLKDLVLGAVVDPSILLPAITDRTVESGDGTVANIDASETESLTAQCASGNDETNQCNAASQGRTIDNTDASVATSVNTDKPGADVETSERIVTHKITSNSQKSASDIEIGELALHFSDDETAEMEKSSQSTVSNSLSWVSLSENRVTDETTKRTNDEVDTNGEAECVSSQNFESKNRVENCNVQNTKSYTDQNLVDGDPKNGIDNNPDHVCLNSSPPKEKMSESVESHSKSLNSQSLKRSATDETESERPTKVLKLFDKPTEAMCDAETNGTVFEGVTMETGTEIGGLADGHESGVRYEKNLTEQTESSCKTHDGITALDPVERHDFASTSESCSQSTSRVEGFEKSKNVDNSFLSLLKSVEEPSGDEYHGVEVKTEVVESQADSPPGGPPNRNLFTFFDDNPDFQGDEDADLEFMSYDATSSFSDFVHPRIPKAVQKRTPEKQSSYIRKDQEQTSSVVSSSSGSVDTVSSSTSPGEGARNLFEFLRVTKNL